ncbi:MAG: hypothetical protein IJI44_08630 [Erysipelotrichaceae bacterium]|nr:hypothetical protein [Erysipelotrichaceae bacterium]
MPDLYILFEKSNSMVGKIGRLVMPYPYTHVTISFDGKTYHSFSRRKLRDPFDAGFTDEKLAYFAYEEVEVKIYTLKISEEEKTKIEAFIDQVKDCPFDVADMILMPLIHGCRRRNAYNCMSFVAEVLEILSYPLPNRRYKNSIEDIENALIRKGLKGEIVRLEKQTDEEYMKKVGLKDKLSSCLRLFHKLYGKRR